MSGNIVKIWDLSIDPTKKVTVDLDGTSVTGRLNRVAFTRVGDATKAEIVIGPWRALGLSPDIECKVNPA